MGETVLADAQFGVARILRPVTGFTNTYEGVSAARPIYMFEGDQNLDKLAADGTLGYDPTLAKGLSVPLGARVVLWLPNLFWDQGGSTFRGYEWIIMWRLRNVFDFRQERVPFHYPKQGAGVADTTAPAGQQERVVIPAAYQTVTYMQTEPTSEVARVTQHVRGEDLEFSTTTVAGPFLADGTTEQAIEQGILDPTVIADAKRPQYMIHEVQAFGDEMLIAARRDAATIGTWAFGTTDLRFAQFLGDASDVGVLVSVGSAP